MSGNWRASSRPSATACWPWRRIAASNPRIVLLTPGPHNETYFEHSFLARYWGFPLVEGEDLTVRDNRVFLKTLAGLEPVDVILRRMDDSFCDPLELRGDSLLGVPGLVQAVRAGNVAMANALGSGLMETPGHMAFLPALCRHLLGEDLRMPSVATWWCGEEEPRRYVLEHLEQLVIKPAFPRFGVALAVPRLHGHSGTRRAGAPHRGAAGAVRGPGTGRAVHRAGADRTRPGGAPRGAARVCRWDGDILRRHARRPDARFDGRSPLVVSMQLGGGSKDTWVLGAPSDGSRLSPRPAEADADLPGQPGDLPSRVADNLFWLGRYTERVEASVRLVRALLPGLSGEEDFGRDGFPGDRRAFVVRAAVICPSMPSPRWRSSAGAWRACSPTWSSTLRAVPPRLEPEAYPPRVVALEGAPVRGYVARAAATGDGFFEAAAGQFGAAPGGRNESAGPRHRHALGLCGIAHGEHHARLRLAVSRHRPPPGARLADGELLRSAIAQAPFENEPYLRSIAADRRQLHHLPDSLPHDLRTEYVLELLLADEANPRSVAFQLATLLHHDRRLQEHEPSGRALARTAFWCEMALTAVRGRTMEDLARRDAQGRMGELEELMGGTKNRPVRSLGCADGPTT